MKPFQAIHKFPFLTNYKLSVKGSIGPNESTVRVLQMLNLSVDISEENLVNKNNGESYKFNRSSIYQLTCPDGSKKYTGQTGRSFHKRYNEHL
jgi:hypothetical protein